MESLSTKLDKRIQSFWTFQIGGWIIYSIIFFLSTQLFREINFWEMARLGIIFAGGFVVTSLLRYVYRRIDYRSLSILTLIGIVLLSSVITAQFCFWITRPLYYWIRSEAELMIFLNNIQLLSYFYTIFYDTLVIIGWSSLYFTIKFWLEWSLQIERTENAHNLAQKAQLQMLRYQLNPHFLFNALNSIRALVGEDKRVAKMMVTELSEYLRYSLISKGFSEVSLGQEIEAVRNYFSIQKRRYEDKLLIDFDIDPRAEEYPIISFLIHPLIENAIKYGMLTSHMPLKVTITTKVRDGSLIIEVANSGRWIESQPAGDKDRMGTGTGLSNVRQRLEYAYPGNHEFSVDEKNGYVIVTLKINNSSGLSDEKTVSRVNHR